MAGTAGRKNRPESRLRNGAELRSCQQCGAEFWVPRWMRQSGKGAGKFCSRPCWHSSMRGKSIYIHPRGADVIQRSDGYLMEWAPEHPRSHDGRVLQHIIVAEKMLGRPLERDEEVHHLNRLRDDNRPANLEVLTRSEHNALHRVEDGRRPPPPYNKRDSVTGRYIP